MYTLLYLSLSVFLSKSFTSAAISTCIARVQARNAFDRHSELVAAVDLETPCHTRTLAAFLDAGGLASLGGEEGMDDTSGEEALQHRS